MPAPCPGICNIAWREAEQQLADSGTEHHLTPTWGQPIHCPRCTDRAHQQLADLPELVVAVRLEAVYGTAPRMVGSIGRTATSPAFPGQASRVLAEHIVMGLLGLEDVIRAGRRLPNRTARGREGTDLAAAVTFLRAHLGWALDRYPGETDPETGETMDPAALIRQWHRAAEKFTRRDARLEHRRIPCPKCQLLTLFRAEADDYIACRNLACEVLLTPAEFEDHAEQLARQYGLAKAS